jgi:hypothetical protein
MFSGWALCSKALTLPTLSVPEFCTSQKHLLLTLTHSLPLLAVVTKGLSVLIHLYNFLDLKDRQMAFSVKMLFTFNTEVGEDKSG